MHKALLLTATLCALAACGKRPEPLMPAAVIGASADETIAASRTLVATMRALDGYDVRGTVVLVSRPEGIVLGAALDGVPPGMHAVRVHTVGDCSASDGSSVGGRFAPDGLEEVGDFGHFESTDYGQGKFSVIRETDRSLDEFSDRAVIVHLGAHHGDPADSHAAGSKIACGVFEPYIG